jgi:hypothetical protein
LIERNIQETVHTLVQNRWNQEQGGNNNVAMIGKEVEMSSSSANMREEEGKNGNTGERQAEMREDAKKTVSSKSEVNTKFQPTRFDAIHY